MDTDPFLLLPIASREAARQAVTAGFGDRAPPVISRLTGGVSAQTFRLDFPDARAVLRLDAQRDPVRNPERGHASLGAASAAGIAPRLRYADATQGIAIVDFVEPQPLSAFPGGSAALCEAMGEMLGRLHALPSFPELMPYPDLVSRMFAFVRGSGLFAPGLLDPHAEGFERLRAACPWDAAGTVASHNDPNVRNWIFDGRRLWLIDWETAFRNDPHVDLAILCEAVAVTPVLKAALLAGYAREGADRPPPTALRLHQMRLMTRLFYACALLAGFARVPRESPEADLSAPTPAEFQQQLADGRLREGDPRTLFVLGKSLLAVFAAGLEETP